MTALPYYNSPWPAQTPTPSPSRSKKKRQHEPRSPQSTIPADQISDDPQYVAAQSQCQTFSGNDVVSCFPTSGTIVYQHQYSGIVWNSRRPQITPTNEVNLYLFDANSLQQIMMWYNLSNPVGNPGTHTALVNDTWFGAKGNSWQPGVNMSYNYFYILTSLEKGLDGTQTTLDTFTAIQTTYLDSVASSISSASSLSSASLASASLISTIPASTSAQSSGSVQPQNNDAGFPHWAVAVIVVLGFLAIVAGGVLTWLIMRRLRRRDMSSNRGSMGSSSPMMANVQNANSPKLPLLGSMAAGGGAAGDHATSENHHAPSVVLHDGASTISRANSAGDGPFSGADAAIMADAFRKALRKPDFAGTAVEDGEGSDNRKDNELLNRELAEEGRDIRSVSSSRGVRVETLSDAGDTVQDH